MPRRKLEYWQMTPVAVYRWAKANNVFCLGRGIVQIVIVDLSDPIGVMMEQPVRMNKENGAITCSFCVNRFFVDQAKKLKKEEIKPYYVAAVYKPEAKTFMCKVNGELLPMLLTNPSMRYMAQNERERVRKLLGIQEEVTRVG